MPKIGVDCRLSGTAHAGIGRYIENIIKRLPKLAPEIDWHYYFFDKSQIIKDLPVNNHLVPIKHYSLDEHLKLGKFLTDENLDLLHTPHFNVPLTYQRKFVVTIHDLLWHEQTGSHVTTLSPCKYWLKYWGYKWVVRHAVNQAQKVLVPAQTIKKTVGSYYPHAQHKIVITPEGIDQALLTQNISVKKAKHQLIYVGSLYPHKNIKVVLQALTHLTDWQLWIVGARNIFLEKTAALVKDYQLESQVKFLGYLDDQDLAQKIKEASILVQPSLSEGFGLTGVEAMALGTPVLASDIDIFHEVYQDGAVYFNPRQVKSFIESLQQLATHPPQLDQLQTIAKKYDWDKTAALTLAAYLKAL